jgi:hypothetical protein
MMVAIQIDPVQNSQVAEWRTRGKYSFPVLLLPPDQTATRRRQDYAFEHYGVWLAPTDLLLDTARRVVFRHVGGTGTALEVESRDLLGMPPFEGLEHADPPGRRPTSGPD